MSLARQNQPLFFCALRETLREGYSWPKFKKDLAAAFIVSLVALPLSMALSIAVGLPPQHGLYTAIVAGIVAPLFGGAKMQVSGPTAAFVVILAPIVAQFGLSGLIWCQLLAGVFLLFFAVFRLGRFISYVPYPVTTGFTAGIAVILGTISLNDFLGLGLNLSQGHFPEKLALLATHIGQIDIYETATGMAALLLIIYGQKLTRLIPSTILGVGAAIALSLLFAHLGHPVDTIASKFSYTAPGGGSLPGIPPSPPSLHIPAFPDLAQWRHYVYPALIIALLAALESLLSATVADSMAGTRHNPNAELVGIAAGNLASGLFAGIPATGAIARTAALINNGATSLFASAMHAVFIFIYMLALSRLIGHIPMAALAAILIHTAWRMSHWRQFVHMFKIAPRSDIAVLLACFLLTVIIDMVAGVTVGMVLAALLLMKRVTDLTHIELEGHGAQQPNDFFHLPPGVMVYRIHGPLFFSTAEKVMDQAGFLLGQIKTLIVDMSDVDFIDMTGLAAIRSLVETMARRHVHVILAGGEPVLGQVRAKLEIRGLSGHAAFAGSVAEGISGLARLP
jgi:SulP family sulfate permease